MISLEEQLRHQKAKYEALKADVARMQVEHEEQISDLEEELAKLRKLIITGHIEICTRCQDIVSEETTHHGCSGPLHQEVILCADCYKDHLVCDNCNDPICSECHYDRQCGYCRESERSRDRN